MHLRLPHTRLSRAHICVKHLTDSINIISYMHYHMLCILYTNVYIVNYCIHYQLCVCYQILYTLSTVIYIVYSVVYISYIEDKC